VGNGQQHGGFLKGKGGGRKGRRRGGRGKVARNLEYVVERESVGTGGYSLRSDSARRSELLEKQNGESRSILKIRGGRIFAF